MFLIITVDPLTNTWDVLDTDLMRRLGNRRWVSMTLERKWALPATEATSFLQPDGTFLRDLQETPDAGRQSPKALLEYVYDAEAPMETKSRYSGTVFSAKMPGAMTSGEVESHIDLDHWKVLLKGRHVNLEVRSPTCSENVRR